MERVRNGEALQQVHDLLADMIKQAANEPSLGLYFVQQHVHKAVPAIVSFKGQLIDGTQDAELSTEDAKDALVAVKTMKDIGPPVIDRMVKLLNSACHGLQPSRNSRGSKEQLVHSVSEIAKDARNLVLQSSPFRNESPRANSDSTNYVRSIWDTALVRTSSVTRRSPAADIRQGDVSNSSVAESPLAGSPGGYVRSVFESAIQRAGNIGWTGSSAGSASTIKIEDDARSSSSTLSDVVQSKPARYVRTVIDTAFMRRKSSSGEEVEARGADDLPLDSIPGEETYDKLQAEHAAKLEEWLREESVCSCEDHQK